MKTKLINENTYIMARKAETTGWEHIIHPQWKRSGNLSRDIYWRRCTFRHLSHMPFQLNQTILHRQNWIKSKHIPGMHHIWSFQHPQITAVSGFVSAHHKMPATFSLRRRNKFIAVLSSSFIWISYLINLRKNLKSWTLAPIRKDEKGMFNSIFIIITHYAPLITVNTW